MVAGVEMPGTATSTDTLLGQVLPVRYNHACQSRHSLTGECGVRKMKPPERYT